LHHANGRRGALFDAHPEREPELLFEIARQRLGDGEDELPVLLHLEGHDRPLDGDLAGDERLHALVRRGQSTGGRGRETHRLGEQPDEHSLVDLGDLEEVRDQVAAVDHLAGEGLLDLTHGRDLALDDE
jgi:hypothetical protein